MRAPSQAGKGTKRRRRTAVEARREILAVAERHLAGGGLDAIRLGAVAREIGVTHQAILRHFRTREELIASLLRYAGKRLRQELSVALLDPQPLATEVRTLFVAVDRVFRRRGYARLSAWLLLAGERLRGSGMFREAAEAIHRQRLERARTTRTPMPRLEDTLFAVALLNLAVW